MRPLAAPHTTFLLPLLVMACGPGSAIEGGLQDAECSDGRDNDQNGAVDCEEPSCAAALACRHEAVVDTEPVDTGPVTLHLVERAQTCIPDDDITDGLYDEHILVVGFAELGLSLTLNMMVEGINEGAYYIETHPFPLAPEETDPDGAWERHRLSLVYSSGPDGYRSGAQTKIMCSQVELTTYALQVEADGGAVPACYIWGENPEALGAELGISCEPLDR